ncbi:chemotaxis protein CheA [Actinotalea sp. M2MS4P-6]|uniref:chemotaxis protein CheA n=1 Tax=Actinotalea sp. M2MS4P-6 TaxID=2983762 RepID=UPI0021E4F543|nr:chemotaxis protein CheA [Actinotalea sp. M2MS4P-6]MCV2392767.1 chemotaxis protein CheA [Actinotalea sp. M2MS4P-6]
MEDLDEIVHEFLVESHENLDQLDSDLVALESAPGSRELLSSVFRTIHTIKGTSGFLAFSKLESLTHVGENLLVELRDGRRSMDQPTTDVLLRMVDTVRDLLRQIERSGTEGDADVTPVVAHLEAVLAGEVAAAAEPATAPEPVEEPAAEPEQAVAEDQADQPVEEPAAEAAEVPAEAVAKPVAEAAAKKTAAPRGRKITPKRAAARTAASEPPEPVGSASVAVLADQPVPPSPEEPVVPERPAESPAATRAAEVPHPHEPSEPTTPPSESAETTVRSAADTSIRVDVDLLDALMRQVSELVLARNAIARLANEGDVDLARASQRLSLIASELQEGVMKTRMQPIEHVWSKVPRMVRDLAAACGRQVRLEMVGGDTELDRSLLEAIKDPLTHLIRNAVDHGIEAPADRTAAGKPAQGLLSLRAYHAGGQVVVEVTDDGSGIDPEVVAAKAVEKGLRTPAQVEVMAPADLLQLLFLPGFSTAKAVTNVSGRGVGMDVVRTKIEAIGGAVDVESNVGIGTTWRLRIPLTLAIMPAVTVECDRQTYAIPQVSLLELVALDVTADHGGVEYVRSAPVYRLRGDLLPLVDLREVFGRPERDAARATIAVLQTDTVRFGLLVDRVLNTEEIVVKPLSARLKSIGLYAGATLMGDGQVALILDIQGLARRSLTSESVEQARRSAAEEAAAKSEVEQVLVAGIGDGRRVAIPLSAVTRLERLPLTVLEHVGSREVMQYRGSITPVVRLDRVLGSMADVRDEIVVVVYSRGERAVAIVVDEIVDIVDDAAAAHSELGDLGLVGSTVLKDRVTELLDVRAAVAAADPMFFDDEAAAVLDLVEV